MSTLTNQQICVLAAQMAKCPGYTTQSGQAFNFVHDDLVLNQNLKVNRKTQSITVQGGTNGPFSLETDYLRTYDMFFFNNNLPYFLNPITNQQYDAEFKDPSISNYPYEWTSDLSVAAQTASGAAGQLYIYPQSSGQIVLTHRYMCKQPVYSAPQSDNVSVSWFPDQDYLVTATATRLMMVTDDERYDKWVKRCEDMLRRHLILDGDEQSAVTQIQLDPRKFRTARVLRPTKITD